MKMNRQEYIDLIDKKIKSLPSDVPFPHTTEEWAPFARAKQAALIYALEMLPKDWEDDEL